MISLVATRDIWVAQINQHCTFIISFNLHQPVSRVRYSNSVRLSNRRCSEVVFDLRVFLSELPPPADKPYFFSLRYYKQGIYNPNLNRYLGRPLTTTHVPKVLYATLNLIHYNYLLRISIFNYSLFLGCITKSRTNQTSGSYRFGISYSY